MNTSGISQPTPIQETLRVLLSVRSHGEQERVACVAGLCPIHLSNGLNPNQPHAIRPDQFVAIIRAGRALSVPGFAAFAEHIRTLLAEESVVMACNGVWSDEATAALCEVSQMLRTHCRTPLAADLSPAARKDVLATALRGMELLSRLVKELEQ